ncbi:ATP-binding cassette domain-containing protein [Vibrio sp. 10N.261.55.A7]|uniref:ATP-binding cassette domain-containing protein n=1 Tax=Vibrio sp. 10N.261.55.A7 TaxID=1880851 RepID=UPI000C84636B|nr:ATP-binding cassette domain-containing protein [Vibrio sp. 10N.261.55.A7]PMJ99787.1 hypothetical protein BCU12_20705 [Vibrio sp. 10N.261.55.A7]
MHPNTTPNQSPRDIFANAAKQLKISGYWLLFFSLFINLFVLALPFYSLQVFDRVLTSQSLDTLWLLSIIAIAFIILHATLDWIRNRMLLSISENWSTSVGSSLHNTAIYANGHQTSGKSQILDLMKGVRSAISSSLAPLFDLPWTPLLLLFLTGLHPLYGIICATMIALLISFSFINCKQKMRHSQQSLSKGPSSLEETNTVKAMGMTQNVAAITHAQDTTTYAKMIKGLGETINITSTTKFIRSTAQVSLVAIGAILVIDREITAGAMIAATMLSARVFSPYESMVNNLYAWINATRYWKELQTIVQHSPMSKEHVNLPTAQGNINVENLMLLYPQSKKPFLSRININIPSGSSIAIVGESGSGKSTLLKAMAGLIKPSLGQVRFDGASYEQWYSEGLSELLGYYSTDAKFVSGTLIQNLSLFKSNYDVNNVYNACKVMGVHEQILKWPKGYDSDVELELMPSSSEYHKLLLARTLFSTPKVLILDQPDAFLGPSGEKALHQIIATRKHLGLTTIFSTNQSSLLAYSDRIILLENGSVKSDSDTRKVAAAQKMAMKKVSNHD